MDIDLKKVEELTERLLREVAGIMDKNQRSYALAGKLKRRPPEMILEFFRLVYTRSQEKVPLYQDGFRVLSDIRRFSIHLGRDVMSEVYTLARRKDYQDIVRFLSSPPPAKRLSDDENPYEDLGLRELSLGEKKSLARSRDRDFINRILHEQHPAVINILLQNPFLTIKEVIKIASKRPTNQQVLLTVYRHMKWINYYSVKKALVNNPYCPTQMALSLLHYLLEQDIADVAESQMLHPKIQEAAQDILEKKLAVRGKDEDEEEGETE
jgi:hypothetical protein